MRREIEGVALMKVPWVKGSDRTLDESICDSRSYEPRPRRQQGTRRPFF